MKLEKLTIKPLTIFGKQFCENVIDRILNMEMLFRYEISNSVSVNIYVLKCILHKLSKKCHKLTNPLRSQKYCHFVV